VDEQDHLIGVMNMRDLLLAAPDRTLESVMRTEVFAFHCFTDREEAAMEFSKRRYFAAPVVDSDQRILGIIKAEQLIQGAQEELVEDLQRMVGAGGDERTSSPVSYSLRKRLPWLHVNLITAFMAAGVVAMFEDIIAKLTVLAVFLPVVAGQGGNAGAQSLAVVMRGLVMREIPRARIKGLVLKETWMGALSGTITGTVTALVAWAWNGNPWLGLVIGLAMIVNLLAAGFSGAFIPIAMKAVGLDPAQCSSIILTTVTDVVGFFAFLGFAVVFQSRLM
jgi:magnesium transporter